MQFIFEMQKSVLLGLFLLMAAVVCGQSYTMPSSGSQTITACSGVLLDSGGEGDYQSGCDAYMIINPAVPGCKVKLTGSYETESGYDYIRVYNGTTTSGTQLGNFSGTGTCNVTSTSGPLLVYFHSDISVQRSGFEFNISCAGGCMCANPNVTVTAGNQTAVLSWNSSQYTNGYILEYGPHGFTVGEGTQVYTANTSYTVNNLNNGAEYDFYVWYDCGNDQIVTDEVPGMVSATPNNVHIMTGDNATITSCSTIIYDNGGPSNNYSSLSNNTLHIHPATSGCKVVLTGTYNTESSFDYIRVYNGNTSTGTPIAEYSGTGSINPPIVSTASSGYLTVVFHSDGTVQNSGFELTEFCVCEIDTTCVDSPYQLHGFDTAFSSMGFHILNRTDQDGTPINVGVFVQSKTPVSIAGDRYFCGEDTITLTASSAVSYLWSTGATSQSISVQDVGVYMVTITDSRGCTATAKHRISPIEDFITSINFPTMCAGGDYSIVGSYDSGHEIEMFHMQSTLSIADTAFLPDGVPCEPYGCSYRSNLTFTDYNDGDVVESVDDIYYVRIKMEHSYIGDIYINITCPNGQKADIMRWSGTGSTQCSSLIPESSRGWQNGYNYESAYFGVAYDYESNDKCDQDASANAPGTPWNYCWSNNTTQGYTYASSAGSLVYRSANVHGNKVDSSNVAAGTQFYHPDESFESLIGCPLNGAWYIEVMDGWGVDNGYLFGWELALTDEYATNVGFDVETIVPDAPWTTVTTDTSFIMSPPAGLEHDTVVNCTLHFFDSDGCSFDSIVQVNVVAAYHEDTTVTTCESFVWHGENYTQSGDYTLSYTSSAGCDSILTLHLTVNNNVESSDTLELVQNQLPYYFAPADTTFPVGSPVQFQFSYILPDQYQCDSLIWQTVIIHENTSQSFDTMVCISDMPFTWQGHTFVVAGDFVDTLMTVTGSDSVVFYHLEVDMLQTVPYNVTLVTCDGGSDGGAEVLADLGQPPYTYLWTNAAGNTVSTDMQMSNVPAGTYFYTVSDTLGCSSSDSVIIQTAFPPLDAGIISSDQSVCVGAVLDPFTGTAASGFSLIEYQWQISYDGQDWQSAPGDNSNQGYTYPLVSEQSFFLRRQANSFCGTVYSDVLTISVFSSYIDTVAVTACQGDSIEYEGIEIPEGLLDVPGEYYIEHSFSSGLCDSVLVLHLKVNPVYERQLEMTLCEGAGYFANGFHIPGTATVGLESMDSTLLLHTSAGCDSVVHLHLDFVDTTLYIVSLTEDFCDEMMAELMVVTDFVDYMWSTGEHFPNISVSQPGLYTVSASLDGCRVSAHYMVEGCNLQLYLPNAISPSKSDGLNDVFALPEALLPQIYDLEISIFSRWGEQVFYSNDKNFRWHGEVNGKLAANTVFNYIIRYNDVNGKPFVVSGQIVVL